MRRLAIAGAIGLGGAAGTAVFGWLRAKGLAIALGPGGLGVYGQLWSFVLYAGQLAGLGIGVGSTAVIAANRESGDSQALSGAAATTLIVPAMAGVALLVISLGAAPVLAPLLLDSSSLAAFVIAALSIPFVAVQNPLQHVIQGFEDVVGQTVAYCLYGLGFAIFAVVGAALLGVEGAAIGLTLGNVLLAVLYLARSRQLLRSAGASFRVRLARVWQLVRGPSGRSIIRLGGAALAVTVVFSAADLAVRTVLLHSEGKDTAGLWYAMLVISVQLIGVFATAMSYLTAPAAARLAARADPEGVRAVVDDSVRLVVVTVLPAIAVIAALREVVVPLFFSSEFERIADFLPAQLAGDAMRSLGWTLGVALIPLGYTAAWMTIGVGCSLVFGVAGGLLAARYGLDGAVAGWVAMWAVSLAGTVAVVLRRGAWRPTRLSLTGLALAAAALAWADLLPGPVGLAGVAALSGAMLFTSVRPEERRAVARGIRAAWARGAK
jgi:O-antigen/teichoic acid export membrane protein